MPYHNSATENNRWWIRCSQWLWKALRWVWGAIILSALLNIGSTLVTTPKFSLKDTLLGWLIEHPVLPLSIGITLVILTAFTALVTILTTSLRFPTSHTLDQQNRQRFLAKLHSRYTDILSHSLQGVPQIPLQFHHQPNAVLNTTRQRFYQDHLPEQALPPDTSLLQLYEQASGDLLILGEPGTGKTTQLLSLAKALSERATQDAHAPIPVIVNLSTWASTHAPLHTFLVEDIAKSYDVPRLPIAQWLRTNQLLPFLDSLDEVPDAARSACIQAINAFRQASLTPLVVCSRPQAYEAGQHLLRLNDAVVIDPLEQQQVDDYFTRSGTMLADIGSQIHNNAELRDLIRTPLMLHIVTQAYAGDWVQALPTRGTQQQQQRQLFQQYVQRQLQQQGQHARWHPRTKERWLRFLARQMRTYHLSVFSLEDLQPDWLTPRQKSLYQWSLRLTFALPSALLCLLFFILLNQAVPARLHESSLNWLVPWLISILTLLPFFTFFLPVNGRIKPTNILTWSWKQMWTQVLADPTVVWFSALLYSFVFIVFVGLFAGLLLGLLIGLGISLTAGLSNNQIPRRQAHTPNQGIRRSAIHGLLFWLIGTLPFTLFMSLTITRPDFLVFGLTVALVIGFSLGFGFGGFAVIQHLILRIVLWRTHTFPWNITSFLEDGTTRVLLYRDGGGYRFLHRLLLDYFANLDRERVDGSAP